MARFFSLKEIELGLVMTPESVAELATAINELEMFQAGEAVIFGSVAWGEHTWRSDIDVASFSKKRWEYHHPINMVLFDFFVERYGGKIGREIQHHLIEVLSNQKPVSGNYFVPKISPSTRDHFRLLAKVKGGPYRAFYKGLKVIKFRSRLADIREYLEIIMWHWESLNKRLVKAKWLDWDQLKKLAALENFPKQLMRKILGEKKRLPSPDTVSQIRKRFSELAEPWTQEAAALFEPFFLIDAKYGEIVHSMSGGRPLPEQEYDHAICQLFTNLPVPSIVGIVRQAYQFNQTDR
jgi:predicted nucleotidyltransferase